MSNVSCTACIYDDNTCQYEGCARASQDFRDELERAACATCGQILARPGKDYSVHIDFPNGVRRVRHLTCAVPW